MHVVYKGGDGSLCFAEGEDLFVGLRGRHVVRLLADGSIVPYGEFDWSVPTERGEWLHQSVTHEEVRTYYKNLLEKETAEAMAELAEVGPQPALSAVAQIYARLREHYSRAWESDEFLHKEVKRLCREASVPAAGEISEAVMHLVCAFFGRSAYGIVGVDRVLEYRRKLALQDPYGFKAFDAERTCPPLEVLAEGGLQILSTDLGL